MSTTTNILSQLGVGSGLDVNSIVSSLMSSEAAPLNALQSAASGIQTEISEYGQLSSAYSQLQNAIQGLQNSSSQTQLLGLNVGTSTAAVANATVIGSAAASAYTLKVDTMAKVQQLVSAGGAVDSSAAIGGGTLTIQLGTISGGTISGNPGTYTGASFAAGGASVEVSVAAGSSLSGIRDAINAANAGVSASLVFDGSKYRLALSSTTTGAAQSISISATGDSALTSLMSQDPTGAQGFQETQAASDFAGSLNGIAITGSSNILDKTVSGLSITAYGTGTATLTVSQNSAQTASALGDFVTAWNGLNALVKALTGYDSTTKVAGPLLGDPLAGAAFNALTSATFGTASSFAGLKYSTLASIGLTIDSKGVASIDSAKLSAALKVDPNAASNLFSTAKGNILNGTNTYVTNMIGATGIGGRVTSLNDQIATNHKQQDAWNARLAIIKANLTAQYTALDQSVAKMQSISSFLTNQVAQLNKSS